MIKRKKRAFGKRFLVKNVDYGIIFWYTECEFDIYRYYEN